MSKISKSGRTKSLQRKEKMKCVQKSGKNKFVVTSLKDQLETKFGKYTSTDNSLTIMDFGMIKSGATNSKLKERKEKKGKKLSKNRPLHENGNEIKRTPSDSGEKGERSVAVHRNAIRQKLASKRLKKGLIMLSPKAEAKIYKLKKALHKKGIPELEIKQIIRQKRRSEELQFRSSSANSPDVCFKCRKPGHRFAECKLVLQDTDQGAGVCFSCGSTEHILKNCPNKKRKSELPFAKCFVCSQQGHLSSQCPSNPKGAFPRGGKCNMCGSINHLKKDCPQLNETAEADFTVSVSRGGTSADALDDD